MPTIKIDGVTYTLKKISETTYKNTIATTDLIPFAGPDGQFYHLTFDDLSAQLGGFISGFQGSLSIAQSPINDGFYFPTESGTYSGAGGIVVDLSDGLTIITKSGSDFDSVVVPIELEAYLQKSSLSLKLSENQIFDKSAIRDNTAISSTGTVIANTGSQTTIDIPLKPGETILKVSGMGVGFTHRVVYLDAAMAVITPLLNSFATERISFAINPSAKYVRVWYTGPADTDPDRKDKIMINYGPDYLPYEDYVTGVDKIDGKPLIASNLGEYVAESDLTLTVASSNIFDKDSDQKLLDFAMNTDGSFVALTGSKIMRNIPIEAGQAFITPSGYTASGNNRRIAFYGPSGFISTYQFGTTTTPAIAVPSGTLKIDAWYGRPGDSGIDDTFMINYGSLPLPYEPYRKGVTEIKGLPILSDADLSIYQLARRFSNADIDGDSLAWGYNPAGGQWPSRWARLMCAAFNATEHNYAVPSSTLARRTADPTGRNPLIDRYNLLPGTSPLCVIGIGTNDWAYSWTPWGTLLVDNAETFCGALNMLCKALLAKYAGKQLYFVTPIHRNNSAANSIGKTLQDYADAIITTCNFYGIPVIDLFRNCVINPNIPEHIPLLIPDSTHPNNAGHTLMADVIIRAIR